MAIGNKYFRVLINGQNFILQTDEGTTRLGFYTTRFVAARDPEQAEAAAVRLIRDDPKLRVAVVNPWDDPPMLYATEIQEVAALVEATGFTFYPEDASDDALDDSARPN